MYHIVEGTKFIWNEAVKVWEIDTVPIYISPIDVPKVREDVKEEKKMEHVEFAKERRALESAVYDANCHYERKNKDRYHIGRYAPKSTREFLGMIMAGKFEHIEDNDLDETLDRWDDPAHKIKLRMMPEDPVGFRAAEVIRKREYDAVMLDVRVRPPVEAIDLVREFERKATH